VGIERVRLFNSIIPEVELLCDQMEEFMVSKYFKGKGMSKKIYFLDDKIQEMNYYLHRDPKVNNEKQNNEKFDTADSHYFTNASAETCP